MPVTFQVVGPLADFGNDVRAGIKVRATADPPVKHSDTATHSNEPEIIATDSDGEFTLKLISVVGVWYTITTPYSNAINTVRLAGYIPDVDDPTTGVVFPPGTVISLRDVMDEDPTPGYEGLVYSGPPNVLTIGTVTTGAPGSDAAADIGGVSPSQTLDLVIPRGDVGTKGTKGDKGDDSTVPGPPNVLAVGTVTTGAAGTSAAATITGASPAQTLNLTIPRGDPGSATAFELRGTGSPEGVVTAPVGTYYTDTAITNGAMRWAKKTGTGNTGWVCTEGDTGWRNVSSLLINGWALSAVGGRVCLRRIGRTVWIYGALDSVSATDQSALTLPSGFLPPAGAVGFGWWPLSGNNGVAAPVLMEAHDALGVIRSASTAYSGEANARFAGSFPARDAWPTSLPGTAA